jgi:hypothetical protein
LTLGLAAFVTAAAACLPRGAPPSGRQVVADRQATLQAIVPPNGDGVLRILILEPGAVADTHDLYLVSVDVGSGPPTEQLLVSDADPQDDFGCRDMVAPCSLIDPIGALWVYKKSGGLVRVDPFTGEQRDVPYLPPRSPSGQRFFLTKGGLGGITGGTLYDASGGMMDIDLTPAAGGLGVSHGMTSGFFGEDFYYVTPPGTLMRIPASGPAEQLATGVAGFQGSPTPDRVLLFLSRMTSEPGVQAISVLDPLTGGETALPFSSLYDFSASPDGHWLLHPDSSSGSFTFLDFRTGVQQVVAVPDLGPYPFVFPAWRPGTSQAWFTAISDDTPIVWIVSPGESPISVPGVGLAGVGNLSWEQNVFTADGAHWFFTSSSFPTNTPLIEVGSADDPTGPGVPVNPEGTSLGGGWLLADGRLLTSVYTESQPRSDVFAVDLDTGESVQLAERGRIAAVGKTRFVGMFHFDPNYRGDLTTVELDSGRQTILAPEFAVTAFVEPQEDDLVPPGAGIVYQFQARTDSPYDGIWVVNSP